jgi:hypothetical protein
LHFLERLNSFSKDYSPALVFNMDETCWRLFEAPGGMLAEKGTGTVKLTSKMNEKTSFTAIGAISAAGGKLPLWILAKGRTQRCEQKFGTHPNVLVSHTDSGWVTENLVVASIQWLSREIANGSPCALILDVYPTHRTDFVKATAAANNVELLYVPAGGIGRFQTMDRGILGELKSRVRAEFGRYMWRSGGDEIDYDESVQILARCWNAIFY